MNDIFSEYYQNNFWRDDESVSGQGSNLAATARLRNQLPYIARKLRLGSILDIPCGDYNWWPHIKDMPKLRYVGADIVPELILENLSKYPGIDFRMVDITMDSLPKTELIFCRDLLGHFSNQDVQLALKNIKRSGASWLLATTFPSQKNIGDIKTGEWRPINLASMFGLPDPEETFNEGCTVSGFEDKSLGLWNLRENW